MKINIAIPSYKRATTLRDKTAALLESFNVPAEYVTVFVADDEEKVKYQEALKDSPYKGNIVVGVVGMGAIRNFIRDYYAEGEFIVNLDDDLTSFKTKDPNNEKKFGEVTDPVKEIFEPMYHAMIENNNSLCGVYAASNPFFMSYKTKVGLYYCIGSCWGSINSHDKDLYVQLDDKEDFERTLQHYVKDGSVCRLDNITVISKYYTEDGGMQVERTVERIDISADALVERYPDLCTKYVRETTGHAELRLKDRSGGKYDKSGNSLESFFG